MATVEGKGFDESRVRLGRNNSGHNLGRCGNARSQVVCSRGASFLPWAESWLAIRVLVGVRAERGQCMFVRSWRLGRSAEAGLHHLKRWPSR